jgi:23S rRNA (cytosine1962-C5)-methyltransferase
MQRRQREAWRRAGFVYLGDSATKGQWCAVGENRMSDEPGAANWHDRMSVEVPLGADRTFRMGVRPLPSGQVGVFPEQLTCWQWIATQCARVGESQGTSPTPGQSPGLKVLNLFAYTGGSTLAAAATGAEVVHVDAAQGSVLLARENATLSELADRPIRWIVEEATKFCRRELKRGNRYDGLILDPPSYGHGPKGEVWVIKRDFMTLLKLCGELTEHRPKFALVTCHTPGIGPAELAAYFADGIFGHCGQPPRAGELTLETADGRRLPSGVYARWPG